MQNDKLARDLDEALAKIVALGDNDELDKNLDDFLSLFLDNLDEISISIFSS